MDAALLGLARQGYTTHPELSKVILARKINGVLGGGLVGPWDVDELDETTLDACLAIADDLAGMRKGLDEVERVHAEWRRKHATYRK